MILIDSNSFREGFHSISMNSYDEKNLSSYISQYERGYLCQLLGEELLDLFIADLDENKMPVSDRFKAIYNPFCKTIYDRCKCKTYFFESFGMVDLDKGFIYYHYVGDQPYKNTVTGVVKNQNSNSEVLGTPNLNRIVEKRYNQSVLSYRAIQVFIEDNIEDYSEYEGVGIDPKFLNLI